MGTAICSFLAGNMGFHALGLESISNKTKEIGNGIKIGAGLLEMLGLSITFHGEKAAI